MASMNSVPHGTTKGFLRRHLAESVYGIYIFEFSNQSQACILKSVATIGWKNFRIEVA